MENIKNFIGKYLKGKGTKALTCLFTGWITVSAAYILLNKEFFYDLKFFSGINIFLFILTVFAISFSLFFIKSERIISVIMIICAGIYCLAGINSYPDFYFALGLSGVLSGVVYFAKIEGVNIKLHKAAMWTAAIVLILGFTLIIGINCCLRYNNYWTPCYDFGIFSQMFYYMKETGMALTTCERDGLLSHFAVHFSPIYYLLLPFYIIFPTPITLMIGQCAITASGILPLIKICKNHKLSNLAALAFGACYIFYPAMAGGCNYYIHENNFLAPLILWLIYFMEKERNVLSLVFGLALLSVKEDAAIYAAVIALYFIFANKNYKCSISLLIISVLYFISVTSYLSVYGDGVMTGRYDNYIYDEGGLFTVIKAVVQNPVYALQQCFAEEKIKYFLQMLAPLMFMPFCTKKTSRLPLLIPFVLVNLMTNYRYQFDIMFQYGMGSGAMLLYLSVLNYSDMGKRRGKLLLCSSMCSVIVFTGIFGVWLSYYRGYEDYAYQRETLDYAAGLIPEDASVASGTYILSNLSQRKELYQLETTEHTAEYYVLDLRYEHEDYSLEEYLNDEYEQIFLDEKVVGVFRRKDWKGRGSEKPYEINTD